MRSHRRPSRRAAHWALCLVACVWAVAAHAHPKGFHKHVAVSVLADHVEALVTLDVDSGPRAVFLRQQADVNKDARIGPEELTRLKHDLVELCLHPLRLSISGYLLSPEVVESKISLREDPTVGEGGISVAVMLTAKLPGPIFPGMSLEVEDESPDRSVVRVQAQQELSKGGRGDLGEADLAPGDRFNLKLHAPD